MLRSIARSLTSPLVSHGGGGSGSDKKEQAAHKSSGGTPPRKKKDRHDHHRMPTIASLHHHKRRHDNNSSHQPQRTHRQKESSVDTEVDGSTCSPRAQLENSIENVNDPTHAVAQTTVESASGHVVQSLPDAQSGSPDRLDFCIVRPRPPTREQSVQTTSELSVVLNPPQIACGLLTSPTKSDDIEGVMPRKVWVKRPGASATRVEVNEDDLFDSVRDVILHKYANSLGRSIDSPDITLKIVSREQANKNVPNERTLSPEENVGQTLDAYYPGGQSIEEALIIEVPQRRTPKPSPRPGNHHVQYFVSDDYRPGDTARDYFPPMPLQSPHLAHVQQAGVPNGVHPVHSMSVLTTGQLPPLPSPGGHSTRRHPTRPKYGRQHTSSPTILHTQQPSAIDGKAHVNGVAPTVAPLPTPPAQSDHKSNFTPPNRSNSPHPTRTRKKKATVPSRDLNSEPALPPQPASASLLDGKVPPINVLIVEDNVINLRLLEQFMRRLKVRWKTAMNGKEAVSEWRQGGFHLVLMDIQLPVMNGLEATKEIRRLESINGIGLTVFGDGVVAGQVNGDGQVTDEDKLEDRDLFKSPVIIVALTASSLQSDRHEALAVGCNDFLTKPVNFGWMERKVTEWGCMQALIDFDGWRKWKEIEAKKNAIDPEVRKREEKEEKAKARAAMRAMMSRPPPSGSASGSVPAAATNNGGSSNGAAKSKPTAATTTTKTAADKTEEVVNTLAGKSSERESSFASNQNQLADGSRRTLREKIPIAGNGSGSSLPTTAEEEEEKN